MRLVSLVPSFEDAWHHLRDWARNRTGISCTARHASYRWTTQSGPAALGSSRPKVILRESPGGSPHLHAFTCYLMKGFAFARQRALARASAVDVSRRNEIVCPSARHAFFGLRRHPSGCLLHQDRRVTRIPASYSVTSLAMKAFTAAEYSASANCMLLRSSSRARPTAGPLSEISSSSLSYGAGRKPRPPR